MQRVLANLLFALILIATPAISEAAKKQSKKTAKTFDLKLHDNHISETTEPGDQLQFQFDEPSAGEESLVQQMKLRPEFNYVLEDDDYNYKNNQYDKQIKLKLNLDF